MIRSFLYRERLAFFTAAVAFLSLFGCSDIFLQPDHVDYFPDVRRYVVLEEGNIPIRDGSRLHYWLIPAQQQRVVSRNPKGMVIQVHGNAQNLSAHVHGLGWLTEEGYDLAIFDYRGYGKSSGPSGLKRAYQDVQTALDYFTTEKNPRRLPVFFYGQSLGGTLLLKNVSSQPHRWWPRLVIVESSFFSYPQIAREKLAGFFLTWPFQWLAYLVISDSYSLDPNELKQISPVPVLLFYSERDPIVPLHNGEQIFMSLAEPKRLITYPEPGHTAAMWVQEKRLRKDLLEAMDKARSFAPNQK